MAVRTIANTIILFVIALLIGGCNTTGTMKLPAIEAIDLLEVKKPLEDQASFVLNKVIANIKRGTVIAHFPADGVEGVEGTMCNYMHKGESTLEWGSGTSVLGNWSTELGEVFHEVLSQKGLNIAGDPKDLFGRRESIAAAEYLVGARISEIRGNFCEEHHWWDGRPLNKFSGEFYVKVEWTIYSSLLKRKEFTFSTEGHFKQKKVKRDGVRLALHQAFAHAAENLMSSEELIQIAAREQAPDKTNLTAGSRQFFKGTKVRDSSAKNNLDRILSSVVTIRLGRGHGSGFIVSEDGLILSNAHVVGEAKNVTVVLNNGLEIAGKVVRQNKQRDVALIKAAIRVPSSLPIRTKTIRLLEKVFVVGTPIRVGMQSTVTSGIVSAIRKDNRTGLTFIQSDAALSPGNSGGPLLDENGNVIGISVSKIIGRDSEGLNMFIPIKSALTALNIQQEAP